MKRSNLYITHDVKELHGTKRRKKEKLNELPRKLYALLKIGKLRQSKKFQMDCGSTVNILGCD